MAEYQVLTPELLEKGPLIMLFGKYTILLKFKSEVNRSIDSLKHSIIILMG